MLALESASKVGDVRTSHVFQNSYMRRIHVAESSGSTLERGNDKIPHKKGRGHRIIGQILGRRFLQLAGSNKPDRECHNGDNEVNFEKERKRLAGLFSLIKRQNSSSDDWKQM